MQNIIIWDILPLLIKQEAMTYIQANPNISSVYYEETISSILITLKTVIAPL